MAHKPYYQPNAQPAVLDRWRTQAIQTAIGAITCAGGEMKGDRLAAILGVSPRALRLILVNSGYFLVNYRATIGDKDQSWYIINKDRIPPPPADLPPLRRFSLPDGSRTARIRFDGRGTTDAQSSAPRIGVGSE